MEHLENTLEKNETFEQLDDLSKEAIEQMDGFQPLEIQAEGIKNLEPPTKPLSKVAASSISFRGGNCRCSCDMSCTRGF